VRLVVSALYCADQHNGPESAAPHLRRLAAYAAEHLAGLAPVHTSAELEACLAGTESPGMMTLLENADALLDMELEEAVGLGVVAAGLTHAGRNRLGDGNGVAAPRGLTAAGREILGRLERRGLALDLAHLAEPSFWQALERFGGPVMSSHTGLRTFCDRPRNLSDEQVAAVAARGGVIGVTVAPEMLVTRGESTLADVIRAIDRIVQRHGATVAAIGSDFGGFAGVTRGVEEIGRIGAVAAGLQALGYPAEAVAAVMGGNWGRFYGTTFKRLAGGQPHGA